MPAATATIAVQKQILEAIKVLSDRMDAQGIASTAGMELRLHDQDELSELRASRRTDPLAIRLESIDKGLQGVNDKLATLNGTVRSHDTDIKVLKVFCDEQVKPALGKVTDIRIELAKLAAQGVGIGAVAAIIAAIAKALGWW